MSLSQLLPQLIAGNLLTPIPPRPLTDPKKLSLGSLVDGVVGYVCHAYMNQLADRMGHMSIASHLSASGTSVQNVVVPSQTS